MGLISKLIGTSHPDTTTATETATTTEQDQPRRRRQTKPSVSIFCTCPATGLAGSDPCTDPDCGT